MVVTEISTIQDGNLTIQLQINTVQVRIGHTHRQEGIVTIVVT